MYGSIISPLRSDGTPVWEETEKDRAFWTALVRAMSSDCFWWLREWATREEVLRWSLPDGFAVTHDYRQEVSTRRTCTRRPSRRLCISETRADLAGIKSRPWRQSAQNFIQSYDAAVLRAAVRLGPRYGNSRLWGHARLLLAVPGEFCRHHFESKDGALHMAYNEVFGADRLAEIGCILKNSGLWIGSLGTWSLNNGVPAHGREET